jgi:hypothetical protein
MTIEDRIRRVLAAAVAEEPPPRGAPLDRVRRRRRRRPLLAGAVAGLLVLAAVVGLAAVRDRHLPVPVTDPTRGWKVYTDTARNLQLRYPPDWVLRERAPGWVRIAPPEQAAGMLRDQPPFAVGVRAPAAGYYLGEQTGVNLARGRLASGQAYVVVDENPTGVQLPPDVQPPGQQLPRHRTYSIDWGRSCAAGAGSGCRTQIVLAGLSATPHDSPLWDRHRAVAETIIGTIAPPTPPAPSSGDRSRPACRADQWRLFHPGGWSYGDLAQRYVLEGGFEFLGGPPCHLRLELRLEVEKPPGRLLPLTGNPSTIVVEGDLPEDAQVVDPSSASMRGTPLNWYWAWQEWCNQGLPQASLRITAGTGAGIRVPGPPLADPPDEPDTGCRDRGRPSRLTPWP